MFPTGQWRAEEISQPNRGGAEYQVRGGAHLDRYARDGEQRTHGKTHSPILGCCSLRQMRASRSNFWKSVQQTHTQKNEAVRINHAC